MAFHYTHAPEAAGGRQLEGQVPAFTSYCCSNPTVQNFIHMACVEHAVVSVWGANHDVKKGIGTWSVRRHTATMTVL